MTPQAPLKKFYLLAHDKQGNTFVEEIWSTNDNAAFAIGREKYGDQFVGSSETPEMVGVPS